MYNYDPKKEVVEIDNFFPKYIQKELLQKCLSEDLRWGYKPTLSYTYKNRYIHKEWTKHGDVQETDGFSILFDEKSEDYNILTKHILYGLESHCNITNVNFVRVMFVFIPPNPLYNDDYHMTPHVDSPDNLPYKHLLYYINDNDAETTFFNQKFDRTLPTDFDNQEIIYKIKPKQGKAVIWDGTIFHAGNVSKRNKRLTLNVLFR